jgi:iron(III) transport system permease protein
MPAILAGALFVFLFSIADFSVTDYVSIVSDTEGTVRAYPFEAFQIYGTNYTEDKPGRREGVALGLPLALLCIGLLFAITWLVRKDRHVTVTSGHRRVEDVEARSSLATKIAFRTVGFLFLTGALTLSVLVPVGWITASAVKPSMAKTAPDGTEVAAGGGLVDNLRRTLMDPGNALPDVGSSLLYSVIAAVIMVMIAAVLGHHMVRAGPRREGLVMTLAFLPLAFGPIMYGAGLIRMWNHSALEVNGENAVYDGLLIVIFMLVGKYLPFALAAVSSSVRRIDRRYEEVAAVAGVKPTRRMFEIVSPMIIPGLVGGLVLGFVFAMRELDTRAMLSAGGTRSAILTIYRWVHFFRDEWVWSLCLVLIVLIGLPFLLYVLLLSRRIRVL